MKVTIFNRSIENPFLQILTGVFAIVFAVGLTALILLVVLPLAGIVLTAVLLIIAFIVIALIIFFPFLILFGITSGSSKKGSGVEGIREKDISPFNKIKASGALRVNIVCGQAESVTVIGDDNLLEYVEIKVLNEVLSIRTTRQVKPKTGLEVRVSARTLDLLKITGAVKAAVTLIDNEKFVLKASGASEISLSGNSVKAVMKLAGAVILSAKDFPCEVINLILSGAAKSTVYASEEISVTITGVGNVICYGNPETVNKTVSGAGNIELK
ncbi:MAG: DUF2807 domain-containing protein [Candidatus Aegiribacteria sp.]|nr:DUF2807 domain-containing protein [Candidatus Aegiribacteria sp.]